jgi:Flp pilus assembly protein TadD
MRLSRSIHLLALVPFVALASSCATHEKPYDISPAAIDSADADFGEGAQRPPSARTLYALARILSGQAKYDECRFVLARLIKEHPHFTPPYSEMAELHIRDGKVRDALRTISLGLEVAPGDAALLNNRGMCWMLNESHEEALEDFRAASGAAPREPKYRANMATALAMLGRYDEALSLYLQVVSEIYAHHNLAVICEARGDHERAKTEREIVEKLKKEKRIHHRPRRS